MPPWPVGASLIEVAREIVELERNVATARTSSVPEAVTSRLAAESRTASAALWDLAEQGGDGRVVRHRDRADDRPSRP